MGTPGVYALTPGKVYKLVKSVEKDCYYLWVTGTIMFTVSRPFVESKFKEYTTQEEFHDKMMGIVYE